jgi:hypothetical protein
MTSTIDLEGPIVAAVRAGQDFHIAKDTYPPFYLRNAIPPAGRTAKITADPGTVLQGVVLQGSERLAFTGLEIQVDPAQAAAVAIQQGSELTFDTCDIHGAKVGDGNAFKVIQSPGFTLMNSELHDLSGGVSITKSDGATIASNRFYDIENDGVQFNGSSHVTADGNHFTNFFPAPGDHSDCIQFQTVGQTAGATDIMITNNVYVRGSAPAGMQGIFMGNESGQAYERVTIQGNAIVGGLFQGIALSTSLSGTVADNLVLAYADQPSWINVDTAGVTLVNNQSTSFIVQGQSLTAPASGNVLLTPAPVGDQTVLEAWLRQDDRQAAPPAVAPPPAPAADPRDAEIAALKAKVAAGLAALA